MIDFFINIDLDYRKLYSYSKMLEKEEDQEIVKDFFRRTRSYYYHIPVIGQRMLRTSFTYPGRVDADGNVISTKRVLNLDEKERILRFLESKSKGAFKNTLSFVLPIVYGKTNYYFLLSRYVLLLLQFCLYL